MKVLNIVGARPNFVKMAPLLAAMQKSTVIDPVLLHTGQHYDDQMSKVFFENLGLSKPDISLKCGGGSHAEQTAKIMLAIEPVLVENQIDLVVVVGDVNSTLATSLVASKLGIPIAHIEAGLRSFDEEMPEEINRIVTDRLSSYLFTTCEDAGQNLVNEGIDTSKIFFVGNLMIDSLIRMQHESRASTIHSDLNIPENYGVVTLHRPSNVDFPKTLHQILDALEVIQKDLALIWPLHPRTKKAIEREGVKNRLEAMKNMTCISPLSYLDNLALMEKAKVVMTDSGGIQEETTVLKVPCLTLRENTERPVTILQGTNQLVGVRRDDILEGYRKVPDVFPKAPPLWDGQAAGRIVQVLEEIAKRDQTPSSEVCRFGTAYTHGKAFDRHQKSSEESGGLLPTSEDGRSLR